MLAPVIAGGCPEDAVGVCAREMGDVQLALLVARLVHGPGSEAERRAVRRHLVEPLQEAGSTDVWAEAVGAWLLGDGAACVAALLPVREQSEGAADAAQLLPALALLVPAVRPQQGSAPLEQDLLPRLLRRCLAASAALHAAGIPALSLQLEVVAQRCRELLAAAAGGGSDSGSGSGDARRAARACAAALLSHAALPSATPPPAADAQLVQLRKLGLKLDVAEAGRVLRALQRGTRPPGSNEGSMHGDGAARGALRRQSSVDTQRSGLSRTSSARLSLDARRGGKGHAPGPGAILGEG